MHEIFEDAATTADCARLENETVQFPETAALRIQASRQGILRIELSRDFCSRLYPNFRMSAAG
jgi:hypothetical protein